MGVGAVKSSAIVRNRILTSASIEQMGVGQNRSEGWFGSLIAVREAGHVCHVESKTVARKDAMERTIIAEHWNAVSN